MKTTLVLLAAAAAAALLVSQPAPREQVGPVPGGAFLLNSGWKLQPAGAQVAVDTFPMQSVLSKDGKYLLVLNGGYNPPGISVLDVASRRELSRTRVPDGWLGLTLSPDGSSVYVGGGSQASVFELSFAGGRLDLRRTFTLVEQARRTDRDFVGDVAVSPDGSQLLAADLFHDSVAVFDRTSGMLKGSYKTGRRPYRLLWAPDGNTFFVSSWADGSISRHNAGDGSIVTSLRVGPHATDMLLLPGAAPSTLRMAVTAANTNSAFLLEIPADGPMTRAATLNLNFTPMQPLGMTPTALGLSPDQKHLYVVCSDVNAVASVDISGERSVIEGFIPTGWYPTAVRALPDGTLAILNGRGAGSYPNPQGPSPLTAVARSHEGLREDQYVGKIQTGSVSFVAPLNDKALAAYTDTVLANSPYRDDRLNQKSGFPAAIRHIIYIVKENRSYDQVLGDDKRGNGDPSLTIFGEQVTPNQHKLAREFALFDNFYVNSDVSADGHNWSTAAIASDYIQKLWPNSYAGRRRRYDYEGGEVAAIPPAGYLWTNGALAGLKMMNFGYWTTNKPLAQVGPDRVQIAAVRDPSLSKITEANYRGFDLGYPDVSRAKVLIEDLKEFEQTGEMPQLLFVRLGNDHTAGMEPGKLHPLSYVADNDFAVGQVVEAVSKSKFWPGTAIFILEDDAQNGPDHVDSHRSPVYVISPWVKRGVVDSTMYNTTSVLRSMELILGLKPMTVFDAAARPMTGAFAASPDLKPFTAESPRVPLDRRVPGNAPSAHLDLDEEDRVDDNQMNRILWAAIKGSSPMPAPVISRFGN